LKAIAQAKKSVEIILFRFDLEEIDRALVDAVKKGVAVHALIASTNRGGEEQLRKLETRLLGQGITVARTAGDLVRYHGKMMLVDRKELFLLAFNLTHLDIDHSRSFGLITRNAKLVREAGKLFDADTMRQDYVGSYSKFVVSPINARESIAAFLQGAKKELLIYDPKISDGEMLRILEGRKKAGVEVRIIGEVSRGRLSARKLGRLRLHTRTILRDRQQAFLGSQSLRQLELDARREIGVIFRSHPLISTLARIFEEDWAASEPNQKHAVVSVDVNKTAKKVAKALKNQLPVKSVVKKVAKAVGQKPKGNHGDDIEHKVEAAVTEAVKDTVKGAAKDALQAAVEEAVQVAESAK
jgi:phosphatidylserine/phosphatidylglycerophosphate/cardiolipin synthase-like enzyme